MAPRRAKDIVISAPPVDHEDLMRKRDAFVTSMAMLQNAANEASRAGLAYFDLVAHGVPIGIGMNGDGMHYARAISLPPGRAMTEEPDFDGGKRKRKRAIKPKDPNAPKKPATPFFLFCSAGRATVKGDMGEGTEFRDIQAELKRRWEELPVSEKKAWSELYQTKLAEWKKTIEVYQHDKNAAQQLAIQADEHDDEDEDDVEDPVAPVASSAPASAAAAAGGFTAVNHSKSAADADEDSEDEDEAEPEPEAEAEVEEPAEAEHDEEAADTKERVESSDSSLTPPPAEKPKRGRKPRSKSDKAVAAAAVPETIPTSDKKPRKPRAKKVKETEEEGTPRRNARKRRKSGTE